MRRLLCLVAGLAALWGPAGAATLDADKAIALSESVIGTVPANHSFVAADGRTTDLAAFRGKPLVVSFVYTGCFQVCPATTQHLAQAVERAEAVLGRGTFNVATIGFNLPADSAEAMRDFAHRHGLARANWAFLSPRPEGLAGLLAAFGFSYVATPRGFDHVLQASILDAEGRIVKQVYGESFTLEALVEPLKALAAGAPVRAGDLAALVERVRLLCTVYDPARGEYRLDYALFAEMAAGAIVLGGTLGFLLRHRRRPRSA
ncbi:MAG: SCO family protein [Pseudomonadota bacterium]